MKVNLKFKIGDIVYVIFKEDDGIGRVFKTKVEEAIISDEGISYYVADWFEHFKEEELVLASNPNDMILKIQNMFEKTEVKED